MKSLTDNRKKDILKYTVFFFAFTVLYHFLVVSRCKPWQASRITYSYHIVDYSFGFSTRFLQGALYHLFFQDEEYWHVNLFITVILLLIFAAVSFFLACFVTSCKEKEIRKSLLVLVLLFLIGNGTFAMLTYQPGILEMYWIAFALLFFVFLSNKYLKFFIPAIFFLCILVHFSCLLSFIVFFFVILFYHISKLESKKEKKIVMFITIISALVTIGAVLYFLLYEKNNLTYNYDEFLKQTKLRNRFPNDSANTFYYEVNLYGKGEFKGYSVEKTFSEYYFINPNATSLPSALVSIINRVARQLKTQYYVIKYSIMDISIPMIVTVMICSPVLVIFYRYWTKKWKEKKGFLVRLPFFAMMLLFPFTMLGLLFSSDFTRWFAHGFLLQFAGYLYISYGEDDWKDFEQSFLYQADKRALFFYVICYGAMVFDPYNGIFQGWQV